MSERINNIQRAIEKMHSCTAVHECSTRVVETIKDKLVWEGVVESFWLADHPKARRCYGWRYLDGTEIKYVGILELPPIDSPQSAVRAAIGGGQRN